LRKGSAEIGLLSALVLMPLALDAQDNADSQGFQLLLGHRSLSTTARYLRLATTTVCATTSPLDLLPLPIVDPKS
jgi:hypothetical protein